MHKRFARTLTFALGSALAICSAVPAIAAPRRSVDTVLLNGKILTVDQRFTIASVLVIDKGRIVASGGRELLRLYRPRQIIDLKGHTAMPGFSDTHLHVFGRLHREVNLWNVASIVEIQTIIAAKAKDLGPGEWVYGNFWDETNFPDRRKPTRQDLDAAVPDQPVVMLRYGGHSLVANSKALALAGITRDTPDTQAYVIERDSAGEPTGIIRESPDLILHLMPKDTPEQLRDGYLAQLHEMLSLGLTSVMIAGADLEDGRNNAMSMPSWPEWQRIYRDHAGELPRATVQIIYPGTKAMAAFPHHSGWGDEHLRLGGIGEGPAVDGGNSGPTICTHDDYAAQPGFKGRCFLSDAAMQQVADDSAKFGWDLGLHMIGDAAIDQAVGAYGRALDKYPQKDPRWFTSHFGMWPSASTVAVMKKHQIAVAAQPNFLHAFEDRITYIMHGEGLAHSNPVATPLKAGLRVTFGSDFPPDPALGLWDAVTRKGRSGAVIAKGEAVDIRTAIRLYTATAPWLSREEKVKGSLEKGKYADLIVLDRDPLTIAPDDLKAMQVEMTMVGGKVLYTKPKGFLAKLQDQ